MEDEKGLCSNCYEEFNSLKLLQCGHAFCMECIKKLSLVDSSSQRSFTVKCPIDQKGSTLPGEKAERLKSKLFVDIPCADCYENKSINDSWWCAMCNLTVCSYCAMTKHKDHTLNEWEDFDVVKECYALYEYNVEGAQDLNKWRNSVHEFCVNLEERLVSLVNSVDDADSLNDALMSIEKTFGELEPICLQDGHTVENIEQKVATVSSLVQKVLACDPLPKISNEVKRQKINPSLPSVEKVLGLVETKTETLLSGIKFFRQLDCLLVDPHCLLCPVSENNVAVFDEIYIRVFDVVRNLYTKLYEWSEQMVHIMKNSHVAFRSADNLLLFTAMYSESGTECLAFYSADDLTCKTYAFLPPLSVQKNCRRLIAVISPTCGVLACSDGFSSQLWLFEGETVISWKKVWVGIRQKFCDVQFVCGNTLLISGENEIFEYVINPDYDVMYLGKVSAASGLLFQLKNNCYQVDKACRKLIHVYPQQNVLKNGEITGIETLLYSLVRVNDDLLCSVFYGSSNFRLGTLVVY